MKRNVNVFIAVVLVAVLCGGVVWLQTADDEKLGWNIHDTYGEASAYSGGAAYTNATFAGPSANEGGVMALSSSSPLRARSSYSYAGAYSGAVTSNLSPLASSPVGGVSGAGLYTTSSQTFKSYGGGGNGGASTGGGMRGGSAASPVSMGAGVGSMSIASPIAYSTARRSDMTIGAGDDLAQMMAENPVMAMANATNVGMGNSFYGFGSVADYSSADYGQYTSTFGGNGRSNVRGRQNLGSLEDSWWTWLDQWVKSSNYGQGGDADGDGYADGGYLLDETQMREAYEDFLKGWNYGLGNPPSPEQWWDWYYSYMHANGGEYWYNGHRYFWTPVGDILPLLLIALLYLLFMVIKSKSLKTEQSE